ncbi:MULTISPECIES: DUF3080 family protein [Rheinheimera]|uniref:DUF3080 family protein n=1 Tax=Rheinheimera marina TaxID=1774958 RepID=A0ABV9JIV3_9GAMM
MNIWRTLFLLPILLSLSSCSDPVQSVWADYQTRLSRVTSVEFPPVASLPLTSLPSISQLRQPVAELELSLLNMLALRRCGLDQLVGERNSSLGKVQSVSQRFRYESKFLQQVQPCLRPGLLSTELSDQLQLVSQRKRIDLPNQWINLLMLDPTLRQQWQPAAEGLPLSGQPGLTESLQALHQLQRIQQLLEKEQWQALSEQNAEDALALLYQSGYLSRWLHSVFSHLRLLQQTNSALEQLQIAQFCPAGKAHGNQEKLQGVLTQVFIPRIQQPLAQLDGAYQQFWPLLSALYQQSPLWPALQQRFDQPLQDLKQQLHVHVAWWQQVQHQCATPGAASSAN